MDDVIIGNASNTGDHGDCIARQSLLAAGWPIDVPGVTLNRFCGSGQTAVSMAAMGVLSGMQDLVVGGGVESMSRPGPRVEGQGPSVLNGHNEELHQRYATVPQGISADLIATLEGFTREQCDELAVRSQDRAAKAIAEGRFGQSVIAVTGPDGELVLDHEEHPRPGTTVESLGGLKPSFAAMGQHQFDEWDETFDQMCLRSYPELDDLRHVHHAGNSSGVVDGAGVVLIASSDFARAHGLTPPRPHPDDDGRRVRAGGHVDGTGPGLARSACPRPE